MTTVIGTLAVDGWAVTFSTARRGLGGLEPRPVPSSLYQMKQPIHQRLLYQLHIILCGTIIASGLNHEDIGDVWGRGHVTQDDEGSVNWIGYADVGGCAKQMSVIKELVELPLRHPSVFETIGIEVRSCPPRHVTLL